MIELATSTVNVREMVTNAANYAVLSKYRVNLKPCFVCMQVVNTSHMLANNTDSFPRYEPKSRTIKSDPSGQTSSSYYHLEDIIDLTRSSSPSDADGSPSPAVVTVPSTSPDKGLRFRRAAGPEQNDSTLAEGLIQASPPHHSKKIQGTLCRSASDIKANETSGATAPPSILSSKGSRAHLPVDVEQVYKKSHAGISDRISNSNGQPKIQRLTPHSSPSDIKLHQSSTVPAPSMLSSKGTRPHLSVDIEQVYNKSRVGNSDRTPNSGGYSKDIQGPTLCSSPTDIKANRSLSIANASPTSPDKRLDRHAAKLEQKVNMREIQGPSLCISPSSVKVNKSPVATTSPALSNKGTRPHLSVDIAQVYKGSPVEHSNRVPNSPNIHPKEIQGPALCSSPSDANAFGSPALATVPSISPAKWLEPRRVAGPEQKDNTRAENSGRVSSPHYHSKEIGASTPCSSPTNIKAAKSSVVATVLSTPPSKATKHHLSLDREQVCKKSRVEHSSRIPNTHNTHPKETQGPTSCSSSPNIKAGTSSTAITAPSTLPSKGTRPRLSVDVEHIPKRFLVGNSAPLAKSNNHFKGIQKPASCGSPSNIRPASYSTVATVPCTPPSKETKSSPTVGVNQTRMKNRDPGLSSSPSDTKAGSSAVATVPSTPTKRKFLGSTEELEQAHKTSRVSSSKPQFYSTVPTARVLRLINEKTRKYGRVKKACKAPSSDR
jgi:hypothetical protein